MMQFGRIRLVSLIINGLRASRGMAISVLYQAGAVGRFAVGGRAGGIAEEALALVRSPHRICLRAHKRRGTPGQRIPLPATGPLRKPHVLRLRNSGGAGALTLRYMAISVMARE